MESVASLAKTAYRPHAIIVTNASSIGRPIQWTVSRTTITVSAPTDTSRSRTATGFREFELNGSASSVGTTRPSERSDDPDLEYGQSA